jgi:uncharacterized membrane protein YkoI
MKKNWFIISVVFSLCITTGCQNSSPKITAEEAEEIVIKNHTRDIGEVEIISLIHKRGKYILEWENSDNCEDGTDQIDDQSGEFIKGETSIC